MSEVREGSSEHASPEQHVKNAQKLYLQERHYIIGDEIPRLKGEGSRDRLQDARLRVQQITRALNESRNGYNWPMEELLLSDFGAVIGELQHSFPQVFSVSHGGIDYASLIAAAQEGQADHDAGVSEANRRTVGYADLRISGNIRILNYMFKQSQLAGREVPKLDRERIKQQLDYAMQVNELAFGMKGSLKQESSTTQTRPPINPPTDRPLGSLPKRSGQSFGANFFGLPHMVSDNAPTVLATAQHSALRPLQRMFDPEATIPDQRAVPKRVFKFPQIRLLPKRKAPKMAAA